MKSWLIGKDPDARKDWGQEEKRMTEDEMTGWHHRLDGHKFEYTPGVCDGQGGLACCDSWGHKESETTEWLNWTEEKKEKLRIIHTVTSCEEEKEGGKGAKKEGKEEKTTYRYLGLKGPFAWGVLLPSPFLSCMQVRKQQLELDMEQQTGSK